MPKEQAKVRIVPKRHAQGASEACECPGISPLSRNQSPLVHSRVWFGLVPGQLIKITPSIGFILSPLKLQFVTSLPRT